MDTADYTSNSELKVVRGDATCPCGTGTKIIMHVCNNCIPGKWGSGFVLALSRKWSSPEDEYRKWSVTGKSCRQTFALGSVQFVQVEEDLFVANMIAQAGVGRRGGKIPLRYQALEQCLKKVYDFAVAKGASVHCPYKMGADRAGGNWELIKEMIVSCICSRGKSVTCYSLR